MIHFDSKVISNFGQLVVAYSAGPDSTAALYFLHRNNPNVEAFHFNHKLRPQNDLMEEKARLFCDDHGIKLTVATAEDYSIDLSKGVEAGARVARYNAMVALNPGLDHITAHHLDDCVESYLMNCFRGHPEYKIMNSSTEWSYLGRSAKIFRPFLKTVQPAFNYLIIKNNLTKYIVLDESNNDTSAQRNLIRHKIRPLIESQWGLRTIVKKKFLSDLGEEKDEGNNIRFAIGSTE